MTIDILSDLHLDFYFSKKPRAEAVQSVYGHIFTNNQKRKVGDILVIAGDLGHYNTQNIRVLELIKEVFGYKHIVCVLGNHDYYLLDNASKNNYRHKSLNRVEKMRERINEIDGMYCLDGNIIEIEGVHIGGCDGWYDGEYIRKHFNKKSEGYMNTHVSMLWQRTMADAHYIFGMDWQPYAKQEKDKIEKIYKCVDIMITHVNPSTEKEHTDKMYRNEDTTGYFTFDGLKYLKEGSMKYWIYGHTHTVAEHEIDGVKCICNPMGYPSESDNGERTRIKSINMITFEQRAAARRKNKSITLKIINLWDKK